MNLPKLPSIRVRLAWPPIQKRHSSLKAWLIGAAVLGGAAIVAFGVQHARSTPADATADLSG